MESGQKIKKSALRWLFVVPGKKKIWILWLILVQGLHGVSGVFYALFLRDIVDKATAGNREGFWRSVTAILLLVAGQLLLRFALRFLNELARAELENLFKQRLFYNILHGDFSRISALHSGEWLNRLTNDTVVVANNYVEILPGFAGMVVKLISALVMIIALEPRFGAILIPGGLLLGGLTFSFRRITKKLHKLVQEKDGDLRIFLQERIGGLLILRAFAAEELAMEEGLRKMADHKAARMRKNRFSNLSNLGFGAAMNGMYLFGACYCGYGILQGTISYGTLTAITQLISQVQAPFANITGYLPRFYTCLASAERLMEIEECPTSGDEEKAGKEEIRAYYKEGFRELALGNVSFTYYPTVTKWSEIGREHMPQVLKGLTLSVKKGEYVAFTGQSGCGKSTAIKLLMGIYPPDEGECSLVDKDGTRQPVSARWRRMFAYVPQGNQLMSGTIREIVTFAAPEEKGENALSTALEIACAKEFVEDLEQGADTLLGERGKGLSEGQMQRLAIARAIYSDCPILLLDEATSSLDERTEKELLENLRRMTDKTVIIITHRPAALSICDRVLEFTEKGIVEK